MNLTIGSHRIEHYNGVSVKLGYDTVGSTFSASFYFDPQDAALRDLFRPARYLPITIAHEGETLITGTVLSHAFRAGAQRELVAISGYSRPGVLEDCEIPAEAYPLQSNKLTLEQIAAKVAKAFGLGLVVAPAVAQRASRVHAIAKASDDQNVKTFLSELARLSHVIVSHDERGNLLLTEAAVNAAPVFDFTSGMPGYEYALGFDGQGMHSSIQLQKQQTKGRKDGSHKKGNAGTASITNPYVPAGMQRPKTIRQASAEVVNVTDAVRNTLSEELKGITLSISMQGWMLGGRIVRPNSIITVTAPELHLYRKTKFFISEVTYNGDNESQTATLTCHLPEVFSQAVPQNIFL